VVPDLAESTDVKFKLPDQAQEGIMTSEMGEKSLTWRPMRTS
jgi:hypothetical protein